jgi:CheY-like chemotaxis protein
MRILLVQTDRDSTAIFTTALEAAGHDVTTTDSGDQAIRLALEHRPDLIMTELVLPVVDGWQILQVLRTYGPLRETPILTLTSHVAIEDRARALELGFAEYLTLPLDPLALVEAVERIADERREHGAPT